MNVSTINSSKLTHTFYEDRKQGDKGEEWVKNFLEKKEGVTLYKCNTPAFMSIDVDFTTDYKLSRLDDVEEILKTSFPLIEVKTDTSTCINQCLEVVSNLTTNSPGWSIVTEADFIFSVFPKLNRCFIYDGQALRAYARSIQNDSSVKTIKTNTYSKGKLFFQSVIKLVSREKLRRLGILIREYKLDTYELMYKAVNDDKKNN